MENRIDYVFWGFMASLAGSFIGGSYFSLPLEYIIVLIIFSLLIYLLYRCWSQKKKLEEENKKQSEPAEEILNGFISKLKTISLLLEECIKSDKGERRYSLVKDKSNLNEVDRMIKKINEDYYNVEKLLNDEQKQLLVFIISRKSRTFPDLLDNEFESGKRLKRKIEELISSINQEPKPVEAWARRGRRL